MACECVQKIQVSKKAPDFSGVAVLPDGNIREISLREFQGKYVVLYFYPLDFTFVCPSEILALDNIVKDLSERNTVLLGCSVDSQFTHTAWRNTARENGGIGAIHHTLIADITKEIARKYNVLLEDQGIALRGLFLIDKGGILRHALINDLPLGRSSAEVIRMVDALQHFEEHGEVCPANWNKGAVAMEPTAEGVRKYLSRHHK